MKTTDCKGAILCSTGTAGAICLAVIVVAIVIGVVAWHWINRKYPKRWER